MFAKLKRVHTKGKALIVDQMLLDDRRRAKRARRIEMLAFQMLLGDEATIVIASTSEEDALAMFNEAKQRARELIGGGSCERQS